MMRIVFLSCIFVLVSCSKEPEPYSKSSKKEIFGPVNNDKYYSEIKSPNLESPQLNDFKYIDTFEFLKTIENLLVLYPENEKTTKMLYDFYTKSDSVTQVEIQNAAYVKAAIALFSADVMNAFMENGRKQEKLMEEFFYKWNLKHNDLEKYEVLNRLASQSTELSALSGMQQYLSSVKPTRHEFSNAKQAVLAMLKQVNELPGNMRDYGISDTVVETFEVLLQEKQASFDEVLDLVDFDQENMAVEELVRRLERMIAILMDLNFIDEVQKQELTNVLDIPKDLISYKNEPTAKNYRLFLANAFSYIFNKFNAEQGLLAADWKHKATFEFYFPQFVENIPEEYHSYLRAAVKRYNLVRTLGNENPESWSGSTLRWLSDGAFYFIKPKTTKDWEKNITQIADQAITEQLETFYLKLPDLIGNLALGGFRSFNDNLYTNFKQEVYELAAEKIQEDFMHGHSHLSGFESKQMTWPIDAKSDLYEFHTGGKEIGQGIISNILWLENVDKYNKPQQKQYNYMAFSFINRLVAAFGYRNMEGQLYPNLHRPFTPTETPYMDIYTYRQESGVFAIPDNIKIEQGYKAYPSKSYMQSVGGMASLLRAATKQLSFFADYNVNSYDRRFTSYAFMDFHVFPKVPLFDLSLGSAIIVLENLTKNGLLFIDKNMDRAQIHNDDIIEASDGARAVVPYSRKKNGLISIVTSEELADFGIAMQEFIAETDRLQYAKSGLLSVLIDGEPRDRQTLVETIPILKKFLYGLGLYFANNMVNEEGLVEASHNIDSSLSETGEVSLLGQMKWMQVTREIYKMWDARIFLWLSFDLYYAANNHLVDKDTGLYKIKNKNFTYYEASEILMALKNLRKSICKDSEGFYECGNSQSRFPWWTLKSDQQLQERIQAYEAFLERFINDQAS